MIDPEFVEKCREALRKTRVTEAMIAANNGPAQVEDIFLFADMPDDCDIQFAIVAHHPDNEGHLLDPRADDLFFAVPVDDVDFMVGVCDVVHDTPHLGRLVARCGYGFWIARSELPYGDDDGRADLGGEMTRLCQEKMAAIVRCNLNPTEAQLEEEADPEYQERCQEIARWVELVKRRLEDNS